VSAPVGPAGTIAGCGRPATAGAAGEPAPAPLQARSGVAFGWSRSDLIFDGIDAEVERAAVVASTDFFVRDGMTAQIAAGALLDGSLEGSDGVVRSMGPGWMLAGGTTWRVLDGLVGAAPYLLLSLTFGASGTRTVADPPESVSALRGDYVALDARFGATVGKTFGDLVSPYLSARAFGGPVIWDEGDTTRLGTDRYHVQIAGGAALLLGPVDLFVEGAPLGEQAISAGVGVAY